MQLGGYICLVYILGKNVPTLFLCFHLSLIFESGSCGCVLSNVTFISFL